MCIPWYSVSATRECLLLLTAFSAPTMLNNRSNSSSVIVKWRKPSSGGGAASVSKYYVTWCKDNEESGPYYGFSQTTSMEVADLISNTRYRFNVIVVSSLLQYSSASSAFVITCKFNCCHVRFTTVLKISHITWHIFHNFLMFLIIKSMTKFVVLKQALFSLTEAKEQYQFDIPR